MLDKKAIDTKRLMQGLGTYILAGGLTAQLAVLQALNILGGEYHATAEQLNRIHAITVASDSATFTGIVSLSLGAVTSKVKPEFNAIKLSTRLLKPKSEELISVNERKLLAAIPNLQKNSHNLIVFADEIEAERTRLRELKLESKKSKRQREISPKPRRKG